MNVLPPEYAVRSPAAGELSRVQALLDACETADTGERCVHEMDFAVEARSPQLSLADNTWVILAPNGEFVGVGWIWTPRDGDHAITSDFYVHPDHRDTVLADVLIDLIEARVAQIATQPQAAAARAHVTFVEAAHVARRATLVARGFVRVRDFYGMRVDLDPTDRPLVRWPAGIDVRPVDPERDGHRLHAADEEAFSEHYLFFTTPYDEWRLHRFDRKGFDPSLWLVAWDGGEITGQVWAISRGDEVFIEDLSVRKSWRGRGLGAALLTEMFNLLAARGYRLVRLYVDVQNVTGALRVYERVGMRQERHFEAFEKPLR